MPRERHVVFVTYTMAHPFAVGVFFRALRLSSELVRRGWRVTVLNSGPIPEDPKVESSASSIELRRLVPPEAAEAAKWAYELIRELRPNLVVFGEEPFPAMDSFYLAAIRQWVPFVVLDQYYNDSVASRRRGVDRLVLYGLSTLWSETPSDPAGDYVLVPPFIDHPTPREELPLGRPKDWCRDRPWLLVFGFDLRVFEGALNLLTGFECAIPPAVITLSHDPPSADRRLAQVGVEKERRLALPLLADDDFFGLLAAADAVVLANGFMQLMEALALGTPALAIHRGIGLDGWSVHTTFHPFVSIEETLDVQRQRVAGWLRENPFSEEELAALAKERHGAARTVDHLEDVVTRPRIKRRLERLMMRFFNRREKPQQPLPGPSSTPPLFEFDDHPEPGALARPTEKETVA